MSYKIELTRRNVLRCGYGVAQHLNCRLSDLRGLTVEQCFNKCDSNTIILWGLYSDKFLSQVI